MIWRQNIDNQTNINKLGHAKIGSVRLYFSLEVLNKGSDQFTQGMSSIYDSHTPKERKSIFDFITQFPFWKKDAVKRHTIRTSDRILPSEIMGISVPTEEMKAQIIGTLRAANMTQVDTKGIETINGIPLKEFISTSPHIPTPIIDRCSKN